jgi:hypothetical protein
MGNWWNDNWLGKPNQGIRINLFPGSHGGVATRTTIVFCVIRTVHDNKSAPTLPSNLLPPSSG